MEQRIRELEMMVAELIDWKRKRSVQQLSYPVDDASRNALGVATVTGRGSAALTQSVLVASTPTSINVPAAYTDTILIVSEGNQYEIPIL